jgi:hypothetical protein
LTLLRVRFRAWRQINHLIVGVDFINLWFGCNLREESLKTFMRFWLKAVIVLK